MNLIHDPWITTPEGDIGLQEALTGNYTDITTGKALEDAALLRLLSTMQASIQRSGLSVAEYLERHAARLNLYGVQPFMQLPDERTEALEALTLNAIRLDYALGRDVIFLGQARDHMPPLLTDAEALRALLAFHQFAPSRGRTAWGYGKDSPLARPLTFHAHGSTLAQTLALNAPDLGDEVPTWESYPHPADWGKGNGTPLTPLTATAYPWWSVTLVDDRKGYAGGVKLASGRNVEGDESGVSADPHTHQAKGILKGEEVWYTTKNPQTRLGHESLVRVLLATLRGEEGHKIPLSFQRALQSGAARVSVTGLSSRNAQPVLFGIVYVELPWPHAMTNAIQALTLVLDGTEALQDRLVNAFGAALEGKKVRERIYTGGYLASYWERVWPTLTWALQGASSEAATADAALLAVQEVLAEAQRNLPEMGEEWKKAQARLRFAPACLIPEVAVKGKKARNAS